MSKAVLEFWTVVGTPQRSTGHVVKLVIVLPELFVFNNEELCKLGILGSRKILNILPYLTSPWMAPSRWS